MKNAYTKENRVQLDKGKGMIITSTKNPKIKIAIALRDRRERTRTGMTRVEGYEEICFAMASGSRPTSFYYCRELSGAPSDDELVENMRQSGTDIIEVNKIVFDRIAYREGADGWLALFPSPGIELDSITLGDHPFIVVAEAIEKPGNLGAILRTADAAGVHAVIAADPVTDWGNPNVVRASKGAVFGVPVAQASNEETLTWLRDHAIQIVVATPQASRPYTDADMRGPVAIVVGAENQGVSQLWLDRTTTAVRIPMFGRVDSLNVATACALLLYETVRQRHAEHRTV